MRSIRRSYEPPRKPIMKRAGSAPSLGTLISVNAPFILMVDLNSFPYFEYEIKRAMDEINLNDPNAISKIYIMTISVTTMSGRPVIRCTYPDFVNIDIMHLSIADYVHNQLMKHDTCNSRIVIYTYTDIGEYLHRLDLVKYENIICCNSMERLMEVCYGIAYPQTNLYYNDVILEQLSHKIITLVNDGLCYYSDIKHALSLNIDIKSAVRDPRFELISALRFNLWLNLFEKLQPNAFCCRLVRNKQCPNMKDPGLNYCSAHKCTLCDQDCRHAI